MLIDWKNQNILSQASLMYSAVWKIKDIVFYEDKLVRFITCGVKHLTLWKLDA
jgi:hypothetical protein